MPQTSFCRLAHTPSTLPDKIKKRIAEGPGLDHFISESTENFNESSEDYQGKLRRAKGGTLTFVFNQYLFHYYITL